MNNILMIKRVEGFVRDRSKRNVATVILCLLTFLVL